MDILHQLLTVSGHKRVGILYGVVGYCGGVIGWMASLWIRIECTSPGIALTRRMNGLYEYNSWITGHGLVMLFVYVMPLAIGLFGNYYLPLLLGTSELVLPRLNGASIWFAIAAVLLFLPSNYLIGNGTCTGWTLYAPLSTRDLDSLTLSTDGTMLTVHLLGLSSALGAVNMISTTLTYRHHGLTYANLGIYLWALLVTNLLLVLSLPVLAVAVTLILLDRNVSTSMYDGANGGDPVLFQHLFWFFGHPEVYIIILPVFGLVSMALGTLQHREIFGKDGMVYCILAIGVIGFAVWGHHMYTAGLDVDTRAYFSAATALVSIPTGVKVFSYLASLSGARATSASAQTTVKVFLGCFLAGGLGGLMLSSAALDELFHDTYFVVGHFHAVLSLGAVFGILVATQMWSAHTYGTALPDGTTEANTITLLLGTGTTFTAMHAMGLQNGLRRIPDCMDVNMSYNQAATAGFLVIALAVGMHSRSWAAQGTRPAHLILG